MKESILPRMNNETQDIVLGGIIKHINDKKLVAVLGEPGEGKSVTVLDFCVQNTVPTYYFKCNVSTTMSSMLTFMANALGIRIVGGNDVLHNRIQEKLREDPYHCFVFDEAEYLAYGNAKKLDTLRQIYDETSASFVFCGTYVLSDLISGYKKKLSQTHNRSQLFRRLRKEEFGLIAESDISTYLSQLEQQYAVIFEPNVRNSLISLCRDRQNGGLGNFIEILELLFGEVRPEWKTISYQIIKDTGRILHNNYETVQSYSALKPIHYSEDEASDDTSGYFNSDSSTAGTESNGNPDTNAVSKPAKKENPALSHQSTEHIDVSTLTPARINMRILHDILHHKMSM